MTLTALGEMTVGAALPGAASAAASGSLGIAAAAPDLDAQLDALVHFAPLPTVSLAEQLIAAESILASVHSAIALGPLLPPVPPMLEQAAALQVTLDELKIRQLDVQASAAICATVTAAAAGGSVRVYVYDGARGSLGDELGAALGGAGGSAHVSAIVLLASDPSTWSALTTIARVNA